MLSLDNLHLRHAMKEHVNLQYGSKEIGQMLVIEIKA